MSAADVEQFVQDLKTNTDLMAKVKDQAAGLDSVVAMACEHGYDISVDEARAYIQALAGQDLTDDQMESLAGGKGHHDNVTITEVNVLNTALDKVFTVLAAETNSTAQAKVEAVVVVI